MPVQNEISEADERAFLSEGATFKFIIWYLNLFLNEANVIQFLGFGL